MMRSWPGTETALPVEPSIQPDRRLMGSRFVRVALLAIYALLGQVAGQPARAEDESALEPEIKAERLGFDSLVEPAEGGFSLRSKQFQRVRVIAQAGGAVRVIVQLNVPNINVLSAASQKAKGPGPIAAADAQLSVAIAAARQVELAKLAGTIHTINRTYATVPFVAMTVSPAALNALERSPGILGINEDHLAKPLLDNTVNITGASTAWTTPYNVDGTGWYVAVLDTGIRATHDFFAGKNIVQACFASGQDGIGPAGDCPNGLITDTTSANAARHFPTAPTSDHGTHVSGIAAGDDPTYPLSGIAPGADIIAVQVFSQYFNEPSCNGGGGGDCVLSYTSDQIAALDHVFSIRSSYDIASVNMSLGGGSYNDQGDCDTANAGTKAAIDNLNGAGIATVIAAGNDSECGGMGGPGCISSAVGVGATQDNDDESSFSNFSFEPLLDIFAPGDNILSAIDASDSSYTSYSGTSMATPHVAGAWAIIKEAFPDMDVATILLALQTTGDPVLGRCVSSSTQKRIQINAALAHLAALSADCTDPPGAPARRPIWHELAPPGGTGYPDYQSVSTNLQVVNSLRLLGSVITRAAQKLLDLTSEEDDEADGHCVCSLNAIPQLNVKKKDCTQSNNTCSPAPVGDYPIWLPTDIYKSTSNAARFALNFFDFLDNFKNTLNQIGMALQNLGSGIDNLTDLVQKYLDYIDEFTEGYHLGGYSVERPKLHLCVGYGGHGAFAEMLNLFGEVSIGGRYSSHNLSARHRAQFRSGGFGVTAFGHSISLLPGLEANLQMDGFKLWDTAYPFGIDFGAVGDVTCTDGPGYRITDIEKYDIFDLLPSSAANACDSNNPIQLTCFDDPNGTPDGCLQPGEFLVLDFYHADYVVGSNTFVWPRAPFAQYDWEKRNTAVISAGFNLPLKMKQKVKCLPPSPPGLPPDFCPGPGFVLFPGATLYPKLTLDAGVEWTHKAFGLRDRLQDMVNMNLPTSLQLGPDDFERPMHYLQAPDVSGDDGTSAYVKPRVAADLVLGIVLGRYLTLGITASIGVGVRIEPAAYGGVHDLNIALTNTLLFSNPPVDLPCDPIIESSPTEQCSNTFFLDEDGEPLSMVEYTCDTSQVVIYHCAPPEEALTCTPGIANDCPQTHDCVAEYGCAAHGYCTRILDSGPDMLEGTSDDDVLVTHDTTYDACIGNAVCDDAAVNAGAPCDEDADCPGQRTCSGGPNAGNPCMTDSNCPGGGTCAAPVAPCVYISPAGYFTPYQCILHNNPEITGWQGPGCHPLTHGFSSACGCADDSDCVSGVETCMNGACAVGGTPVECSCDPSDPTSCGSGRVCEEGGCLLDCTANGNADCAAYQTCTAGLCVNPYGIPFAEQIVWQVSHTPKPQHAVSTYGLSDILASVILDASLWIGLDLKIFKKSYHFDILKLSDAWVLAAFNKTWYQPGLEARYQNDCDPVTGDTVTNWQPGSLRVKRYNPMNANSGYLGNAGTEEDLLQWCETELPLNVADPDSPTTGGIIDNLEDLLNWGEQIGIDVWALSGLCVTHGTDPVVSEPFVQWLMNLNNNPSSLSCSYTYNSQTFVFPCSELRNRLLLIWGCLNTNANSWASILASAFPSTVTTFNGNAVFNLDLMLIDPLGEFTLDNLQPAIRNYPPGPGSVGAYWYALVSQCFEQRYVAMQPGDIDLLGVSIGPCCGNSVLDQQGCSMGIGGTPCEQCDDGNNLPGDGCSPLCRVEDSNSSLGCGDHIVQAGFGEQCDDGNQITGDGCEPDCTLTPAAPCEPTPDGLGCTSVYCPCFGECLNGGYCDDASCPLSPPDAVCYERNSKQSIRRCGDCFGECVNGGYCDSPLPGCSLGVDPLCYEPNSLNSIYLCGNCFGVCVNGSYCDPANANCCIAGPGNCQCYAPFHPISIELCGAEPDCRPSCVNYNPNTHVTVVTGCKCAGDDQCHVTLPPPGAGPPMCVDGCPPGEVCVQTETPNPDGTITICCACVAPCLLFDDDFEAYPIGQICGQGGWQQWIESTDVCGSVTSEQASDGVKSLKIIGNVGGSTGLGDDIVHRVSASGGQWTFRVMTFVPNSAMGTAYVNLLNTYDSPPGAPPSTYRWSVEVQFNANTNLVLADGGPGSTPLIRGQWIELRVEIDLVSDSVDYFYNDVQFVSNRSWVNGVSVGGQPRIQAIDFYAGEPTTNGTSGMYFDALSLTGSAPCPSGCPCTTTADCRETLCAEDNGCSQVACTSGACTFTCVKYGDTKSPANGIVNLDDILCTLAGFSSFANCPDSDIAPCGGNGINNLDDILGVMSAFGGANPCGCQPTGTPPVCGSIGP